MSRFSEELETLREIYNDAWARNWGFVPMTAAEFGYVARDLRQIIDPDLVLIAEHEGRAVGFLLALPDYNQVFRRIRNGRLFPFGYFTFRRARKQIDAVRVLTLGIKQQFQARGLGALFYTEIIQRCKNRGYTRGELSWVLENNTPMNKAAHMLGARLYKRYRIYRRSI